MNAINKTCSCGKLHAEIPPQARLLLDGNAMDGAYWECVCGSTLFVAMPSDNADAD